MSSKYTLHCDTCGMETRETSMVYLKVTIKVDERHPVTDTWREKMIDVCMACSNGVTVAGLVRLLFK